jgi:acyl-CoA synthetase (AMP-forming)/AMP-acid ligase II
MTQLVLGGTAVIMKEFDAEEALRLIDRYRITNMFMAPTMYNFILTLDDEVKLKYDLGSVRTLVSAGAPLPTRVKEGIIRLFPNAGLNEFYGSTESGFNTNLRPEDQLKTTRSVGKPVLFNDIKILDDDGNPVKPGEVGLIYVKNPYFFKGYLDDEEETRRAFREDGYLTVGDMARQDAEGFIYIVDRKKDMVISGGVNIFPAEIEDVLYQHPGVKEAAVIGIPDEKWGESLKAFIVPRGESLSEQEVIDFCKQHLASYKKPKSVEFLTELPRNPAGKVLKTVLREPYWKDADFKV